MLALVAAALAHHRGPPDGEADPYVPPADDYLPYDEGGYPPEDIVIPEEEIMDFDWSQLDEQDVTVYTPPTGDDGIIDIVDELEVEPLIPWPHIAERIAEIDIRIPEWVREQWETYTIRPTDEQVDDH